MNDQLIATSAGRPDRAAAPAAAAPIAIIGLGCRFPGGAHDPEAFWQLLVDGGDAIRPIEREGLELARFYDPTPRTPGRMMTQWGGFLHDLELFDAAFFGVSPREAASIDPAQRLLLEATWEACEDAAIDPSTLVGEPVGVFVGQWLSDFESRLFADPDQVDFHATTGSGRYASSGRLSFFLGAIGPSLTVDTACSSSLVAVHLACQSLRTHESSMAIAAGVNVILQPHISIAYSQSGMMAADGHCKFGDANGDGYVRSEGVGVVLLKPLAAALADGDPIRAVIRGSAVNNDGRGSGHMATPSRSGQAAMLCAAYANAGVAPEHVRYVEAHGTGTRAGDPVELGALSDVLGPGRAPQARCLVGSVKTNIGHTEGAAGMAGLLKCVLALQHGEVPASLHLREPNPAIPWDELPFDVPQQRVPWPAADVARLAGVSAFGITGTNAHVVLEEAPLGAPASPVGEDVALPLVLSAATPRALQALAASYADLLASTPAPSLRDVCATAARHRAALEHRAVFVADGPDGLAERLQRFASGDQQAADVVGRAESASPRRVAFVFPGQGGQWVGMARELLVHEPAFREGIERCDAARPGGLGWTVGEQLQAEPDSSCYRLDEIGVLQPTLLAVEIALALLWRSWGVTPDAVVGHSMGEVGAAYVAGALSLEEAMRVICARSALMQRTSGSGAMAVLELSIEETTRRIAPRADRLCVAVSNGPRSTVVSGDPDDVAELLADCEHDGIFGRAVKVDVASHSAQMDPLVPELLATLHDLSPRATDTKLYSTVDAAERPGDTWGAAYWARNLRQPVLFAATVDRMLAGGIDTVIEVGPHPTLLVSLGQAGGATARPLLTLASLRRGEPERASLLASLGALWAAGHPVAWQSLLPPDTYTRVPLPHYPWQRERHWSDAALPIPPDGASRRRSSLDETAQQWILRPRWDPAPLSGPGTTAGRWLLVGPAQADLAALRVSLEQRGSTVHVVDSVQEAACWIGRASPTERDELRVVLLPAPTISAFDGAVAAVQELQANWPEAESSTTPRLWWITRGAHVVDDETPSEWAAEQAALWGAARVMSVEHPDWWGGLVDLDPTIPAAAQADALAGHLCADDHEDQAALRSDQRRVLRVVPVEPIAGFGMQGYQWRADAAYLITGGLGGVAREIASSMVRDGARRLVLLGRSTLPPRTAWASVAGDTEVGRRISAVRSLEHAGASVHLLQADVADEAQVRAVLDAYAADGWPPIAGVIHAAAVLDNRLTADLDRDAFDRVLAPKLEGALVLDRLFPTLDLFVVFSSFSSFWAPAGMASYVAANSGLDALAQARKARGQHALSIQWGPWSKVGLVEQANVSRSLDDMEREGVGSFSAEEGTALFAALLALPEPVLAVLPIDWPTFRRARRGRDVALFRSSPGADGSFEDGEALATDGLATRLRVASPADRRALLQTLVRESVGGVLRMPATQLDERRPFGSMGLDSLMALELRNRLEAALERSLSATLAWNYPTVETLAAHLDTLLGPEREPADPESPAPPVASSGTDVELDRLMADLSALSDDEASHALRGGR